MKTRNLLVNAGIMFSLLFCMAFACGGETESEGSRAPSPVNNADSGLPAGTYSCFTTVPIYAGQGGGGGAHYPIYNYVKQGRGSITVKPNGTYLNPDGASCRYSYDPETGGISWLDCAFQQSSSSSLTADAEGVPQIQIKFSGDKDVWDCGRQ